MSAPPTDEELLTLRAEVARLRALLARDRPPTGCERDILAALAGQVMPLTTDRLLARMASLGMLHGDSTVRLALARMAREGRVISSRKAPCGYRLPAG
jgi:hypothetical protein